MTIFETLRQDHETQRELLDQLLETSGDSDDRRLIFSKLKMELEIHANGEERFFYKPLIDSEISQEHARHGIAEHHEMDELIEALETTEMDSSSWISIAKDLAHKVKHHLEEEEHKFFQIGGKVLTEQEKTDLGTQYKKYINENRIV